MTYVDVTCLVSDVDPFVLSHSAAEAGAPNQWSDALEIAAETTLAIDDRAAVRDFFADFGAWEREDIDAWSDTEIDALVLQFAAGDFRELESLCPGDGLGDIDWTEAEALAEAGTVSGRLHADGCRLMIYLGS